jgi:crotonobetainyl-CoA:carnitine CoA-transferase CaiB-like acyl-CoA transferase
MDLLSGTRFNVSSYGIGGGYAAWLLRSLGAHVAHRSALDPGSIGAFLAQGATYEEAPELRFEQGVTLITDAPVNAANRAQLGQIAESSRVIWINPWGLDNEWSERPASDLALYAASGWMSSVGEPGREPIAPPGSQCQVVAGAYAAIAALEEHASGKHTNGLVDVPILEALVSTLIYDPVSFQYYGMLRARVGNRFSAQQPLLATLPCKDGHIGLHCALHGMWTSLAALIGHPEIVSDPHFALLADRAANVAELDREYLLPWLQDKTRWEAFHELQAHRIPSSGHPDMSEVLDSPQLRARKSWDRVETPSGKALKVPGSPARVLAESERDARDGRGLGPWRPGALRVADLSMGWAGPLVTLNLAAMGADVIKVESHTHFDWWRGSRPPGDGAGMGLHERSHVFNTANRGKRGITLDLSTPRGRNLAIELIGTADLVVENYGAGILEKLGLTYEVLSARNPSLVMLRQPGFGSDGPEGGYVAFGNTIEGMSGLSSLVGYEDGPPMMLSNATGDPVSGLVGTVAALAGLAARARDGRGRLIECAQLEGFLPMVAEGLIEYQLSGEVPARRGNRRPGSVPSGAYHLGDDRWVVLEVQTDEQFAALIMEMSAFEFDAGLLFESTRRERATEVNARVAEWALRVGEQRVLDACAAAGVPASMVHNESEVLGLEPLIASGFWQGMEREPVGYYLHPTIAYSVGGERPLPAFPAPHLGQHTAEVLEAMGYDESALAELAAEGVTGRLLAGATG